MATLAAVMAVKNEESKIRKCLENLKGFVDEIVVVDMNSTDATRDICGEYTDKVYIHDGGPLGLIPVNKQFGFERVDSDWVIIVDADFAYNAVCKGQILDAINSGDVFIAYRLFFKNLFFGKWPRYGATVHDQILLFKKGHGYYEGKIAHDSLKLDGSVGMIMEPFYHYGHPTIENFVTNMNRYTSQDAKLISEHGHGGFGNAIKSNVTVFQLLFRPFRRFLELYIKRKGFKDGGHGVIVAALFSLYLFLELAKLYELEYKRKIEWTIDNEPDW